MLQRHLKMNVLFMIPWWCCSFELNSKYCSECNNLTHWNQQNFAVSPQFSPVASNLLRNQERCHNDGCSFTWVPLDDCRQDLAKVVNFGPSQPATLHQVTPYHHGALMESRQELQGSKHIVSD